MNGDGREYDLIVVDIDGTLLADDHAITAEVHDVVALARASGVRLTLATGRAYSSAVQVAEELAVDEPIISDGGAVIKNSASGEVLRDLRIEPRLAAAILEVVEGGDYDIHVFYPDDVLVNRASPAVLLYAERLRIGMTPTEALVAAVARRAEGPTMVVLRTTRQLAPRLRARFEALFGAEVQVTSTAPHFVDFIHHDAGKDRALAFMCRRLGIPLARVIAIGDGINDLDMIQRAGLGVLVANAAPELWPHADYVTHEPHYRGIAEVIRRYCLK